MGTPGQASAALAAGMRPVPEIEWPIKLTPRASFHLGLAALVFASPTVLDPADDIAEYGYVTVLTPEQTGDHRHEDQYHPPYEGACVVAWFHPPTLDQDYSIEFSCTGVGGSSFTLDTGDGAPEQQAVPVTSGYTTTAGVSISRPLHPATHEWFHFTLSSGGYWKLTACEIAML